MSGITTRLGIKTWDDSDPFLRTDFNDNWRAIDNYPGIYVCTSSTRPSWGQAQAGQRIFETDTRREVAWSGTAWQEIMTASPVWSAYIAPGVSIPNNTTLSPITMATINCKRDGTLVVVMSVEAACNQSHTMSFSPRVCIDGTEASVGQSSYVRWPSVSGNGADQYYQIPAIGRRDVTAGSHTIGVRGVTGLGDSNGSVLMNNAKCLVYLVNGTDT